MSYAVGDVRRWNTGALTQAAEFKRLFITMAWENDHSRTVLIFSAVVFIATFFGVRFFGWG